MQLETARLTVRLPKRADAPAIVDYYLRNADHLRPYEPARSARFYMKDFWLEQSRLCLDEFRQGQAIRAFMFMRQGGRLVGALNFTAIERGNTYSFRVGYSLDSAHVGLGLMEEALREGLHYMFHSNNMHRATAVVRPDNTRSRKLLERLGFHEEGLAKDYLLVDGAWHDHALYGLINPYWHPLKELL